MKREDVMPGKYLGQVDFPQETLVTIKEVVLEQIKGDRGDEDKAVLYVMNASNATLDTTRGIILNAGNWDVCEALSGELDSDNWAGTEIVVYVDESVMYAGKRVGGVRIREAKRTKTKKQPTPPAADTEVPF